MPKNKLFDDNDSDDDIVSFAPKGEYAKKYDTWREKEELHKLEQKYGDKADPDAPSSSESSDDEPLEVSEEMEQQFLKTLSLLKTRDPRIYDPEYRFFNKKEETEKEVEEVETKSTPKKEVNSLAAAFADSDDDDDDNEGEIFKVEKKAPLPSTSKEDKLKKYLTGQEVVVEESVQQDLAPLKALWSDPKLNENEAFLRDYILNKRYLDGGSASTDKLLDDTALEADEELVEEQGKFERAYNFRFEEPDQEYLKRYPRTMSTIRPKDDRRTRKRLETRTRKQEEKQRKMDDIARLKALKLKQIQEKIAKIKEVTGNDELGFKDEDIEGDFDPAEHDRRMKVIFDEEYYGEADDEKPVFPDLDDELEIENWEKFGEENDELPADNQDDGAPHCEDDTFNMDADYDPRQARSTLLEEIQETLGKKRRNRKNKSKLAKLLMKEKPTFIPQEVGKTYDEYMEEYYKMDCEDVIGGDLPTRFKYRETVPNDFGLTVEEILLADDKELNSWASLKKAVKYRPAHVERGEVTTYRQKAEDEALKRRILPSLFKDLPREPQIVIPVDDKKKKKKKHKNSSATTEEDENKHIGDGNGAENGVGTRDSQTENPKKNKKKKKKSVLNITDTSSADKDNNLEDSKKDENKDSAKTSSVTEGTTENNKASKKKKKAKQAQLNGDLTSANDINNMSNKERKTSENNQADVGKSKLKRKLDNESNSDIETPPQKKKKNKNKNQALNNDANAKPTHGKKENREVKQSFADDNNKNNATKNNNTGGNKRKKNKNKAGKKNNNDGKSKTQNGGIKKDFKNKRKGPFKGNKSSDSKGPVNPLSNLSDERLKAYGLNPKKYRNFLKHKKF